jgi:repressor LexA
MRHTDLPSLREIGEAVGLASTSNVSYHLSVLEEQGLVSREPRRPRTARSRSRQAVRQEDGTMPGRAREAGGEALAEVPLKVPKVLQVPVRVRPAGSAGSRPAPGR